MTNRGDIFQNAQTVSLYNLYHTFLRTCVPFSKKLPHLCFFLIYPRVNRMSLRCLVGEKNVDFYQTLARALSIRPHRSLRIIE